MAEFNNAIITNAGRELASKLLNGSQMEFTRAVTSNHVFPDSTNLADVTVIPEIRQTSIINDVTRESRYNVNVFTEFNNESLIYGYDVRVIGLYAKDLNGSEILYSISTTKKPDYMPPFNGVTLSTVEYCFVTSVSNSDNVVIDLYYTNNIRREEFNNHLDDLMPHKMMVDGVLCRVGFEQENGFFKIKTEEVV